MYELQDYNKTLEMDVETLKAELSTLAAKHRKEKKARQAAESQLSSLTVQYAALTQTAADEG